MKLALLFIAVLSASCGKIEGIKGGSNLGQVRELQVSAISTGEALLYDRICQALTRKADKLETALPNSLSFDVVEKDCDKIQVLGAGAQPVRVEKTGTGEFQFRRQDSNALFVFPSVETTSFGLMKEICAGATQLPVVSGDSAKWVYTADPSNEDCPVKSNEVCLTFERGSKEPNTTNSYRVHTREFIRFNVELNGGKYGYYTHRKAFSTNNCDPGKFTETAVELR